MDPLSISASALGLADITARLVGRVADFIRDCKNVDEVLRAFYSEVSTLDINLRVVGRTILSHQDLAQVPENHEFLSSIKKTVSNIEQTVRRLQVLVPESTLEDSRNAFQKIRKQWKLDKKLPEISRLRLEIVSYNSSLQTVLQAIDISINMRIKANADPSRFADEFFRATSSLEDKLTQLGNDIANAIQESQMSRTNDWIEPTMLSESVVSSMHAAQEFAQRVYSRASSVSRGQSDIDLHSVRDSVFEAAANGNRLGSVRPPTESSHQKSSVASGRAELELLQAQATLKLARAKYFSGDLSEAEVLCIEALEELSEVESTPVADLEEYTRLFQALILASTNKSKRAANFLSLLTTDGLQMLEYPAADDLTIEPKRVAESRDLLATVDLQKLKNVATDELVLDRISLVSWIQFRLEDYKEAEIWCRSLIRDARNWNGDENNDHFNDGNTLLALIHYCQHHTKKGQSLARIIPHSYLQSKIKAALGEDWRDKDGNKIFQILSRPGCEAAAFYLLHHEPKVDHYLFPRMASECGTLPVVALISANIGYESFTVRTCFCHSEAWCKNVARDSYNFRSGFELAILNNRTDLVTFIIEEAGGLRALESTSSCIERAVKLDKPEWFEFLMRWNSSSGEEQRLIQFDQPLHLVVKCEAQRTLKALLESHRFDVDQVDLHSNKTIFEIACEASDLEVANILLRHGVKVDDSNFRQSLPHLAVAQTDSDIISDLSDEGFAIDNSCRIEWDEFEGRTHVGLDRTWDEYIAAWREESDLTPLQLAVVVSCGLVGSRDTLLDVVDKLISAGADPMKSFETEYNCVHLALTFLHADLLTLLVASPSFVDIDVVHDGSTMLQWTLAHGGLDTIFMKKCVKVLIEKGANPMALDSRGQSCFHYAARHRRAVGIMKALLESSRPIDLDHKDNEGRTAADLASEIVDSEGLTILREAGASSGKSAGV